MWSNLGESARLRGDCQAAAELYEKALAIARETANRESEIIYLNNLAGARLGLRQLLSGSTRPKQKYRTPSSSLGRCFLPSLDNVAEILATAEGEDYK